MFLSLSNILFFSLPLDNAGESLSLSSTHLSEDPLWKSAQAVLIALTAMFLPVLLVSIVHGEK